MGFDVGESFACPRYIVRIPVQTGPGRVGLCGPQVHAESLYGLWHTEATLRRVKDCVSGSGVTCVRCLFEVFEVLRISQDKCRSVVSKHSSSAVVTAGI